MEIDEPKFYQTVYLAVLDATERVQIEKEAAAGKRTMEPIKVTSCETCDLKKRCFIISVLRAHPGWKEPQDWGCVLWEKETEKGSV